jgi:hypothetical protein
LTEESKYTLPALEERGGVLYLRVRAQPGASREGVVGLHANALKVAVTVPAEKGKANDALRRAVAEALGVKTSQVELQSGTTSRNKCFRLEGLTREEAERRLARSLSARGWRSG